MKKAIFILLTGLFAAVAGYSAFYFAGTAEHRKMLQEASPELAWLKREFSLSEEELARLSRLHAAYLPHCREMCHQIDAKNDELRELLMQSQQFTPEIEQKLAEASQLRLRCQSAMLKHFFEVSQTMPPEQGRRYLAWVREKTFLADYGMKRP